MSDLIDYGGLYKSLDETAREIMIEHFGFPKSIMPCCANCEYYNGGVHCIRELGAVSDDNNFCILYKPCSTSHKDNNSGILTSDLRDFVNEYESDHNVHLYSERKAHYNHENGINIYMFDDDYYETKLCVGCFVPESALLMLWQSENSLNSRIFLIKKHIKLAFDGLYYHLYHDEWNENKDHYWVDVNMYAFVLFRTDEHYPQKFAYYLEKIGNIRRYC